jgi:hypothetical protein
VDHDMGTGSPLLGFSRSSIAQLNRSHPYSSRWATVAFYVEQNTQPSSSARSRKSTSQAGNVNVSRPSTDEYRAHRFNQPWHRRACAALSSITRASIIRVKYIPPACFDGVVDSTRCFADRALEMFPCNVLELLEWQFQTLRFSLKAALGHSPLPTQSQCCGKKFPPVSSFLLSPRSPKTQIHPSCLASRTKYQQLLRLRDRSEERAKAIERKRQNLLNAGRSLLKREAE